jgi:hypothetical protein
MIGFFPSGERLPSLGAVLIDGAGFIFWLSIGNHLLHWSETRNSLLKLRLCLEQRCC